MKTRSHNHSQVQHHNFTCTECKQLKGGGQDAYYSRTTSLNDKLWHCVPCESKLRGFDNGDMR